MYTVIILASLPTPKSWAQSLAKSMPSPVAIALSRRCSERERIPATGSNCPSAIEQNNQKVPDGGYGWVCVASCFVINALSWGVVAVCHLFETSKSALTFQVVWSLSVSLSIQQLLCGCNTHREYHRITALKVIYNPNSIVVTERC